MVDEMQQPGFGQLYLAKDLFVDQMKSSGIGRQYDIKMRQHGNEWDEWFVHNIKPNFEPPQ